MNGPEHYTEAERLARDVAASQHARRDGMDVNEDEMRADIALAQVHATLALAAATAMSGRKTMHADDFYTWETATGVGSQTGDNE